MLHLRPMQEHEFDTFFEREVEGTAIETAATYAMDLDRARESARGQLTYRLAERLATQDSYFYIAERTSEAATAEEPVMIGHIWVTINLEEHYAWLDSIELVAEFRGQGLGAQVLDLLEAELAKFDIRSLSLHVFAKNERALKLYRKHGFNFTGHNMKKDW